MAAQFEAMGASAGGAWHHAAQIVRGNLIPQWQDEPTEQGEYRVRGIERVCWVYREDAEEQPWAVEFLSTDAGTLATEIRWEPLNGRQVCPIGARPST